MTENIKFVHLSNDLDGLFAYIRRNSFTKNITVSGPPSYTGGYCNQYLTAGPHSCIIDGSTTTSWANIDFYKENMYIVIDLGINKFRISGITFSIPCHHAHTIIIEGSNDGTSYDFVCNKTGFSDGKTSYFSCISKKSYRFFKLSQNYIENSPEVYRFHISEVELFGILNYRNACTCKCNRKNINSYIIFLILMLCN